MEFEPPASRPHNTRAERQANRFARELLIPKKELRKLVYSGKTNVLELAQHFNVSTLVLRIRAKEIGLRGHGISGKPRDGIL